MSQQELLSQIALLSPSLRQEMEAFLAYLLFKKARETQLNPKQGFGVLKGQIVISDDFDTPVDDFLQYMQ